MSLPEGAHPRRVPRGGHPCPSRRPSRTTARPIGSFICYFDHPREFDDEAVPLAEALADQAAQFITRLRLETTLRRASMIDATTGLPSRRLFEDEAMQSLSGDLPGVCVLFIDLDGFKAINDRLGHAAGDLLLGQVGAQAQVDDARG